MKIFISILILSFSLSTWGLNETPNSEKLNRLIEQTFMENGNFSEKKIEKYKEGIKQRRLEIYENNIIYQVKGEGKKEKKAIKKAKNLKTIKIFDLILEFCDKLQRLDVVKGIEKSLRILELDYTTKIEGSDIPAKKAYEFVKNIIKRHSIRKVNLIDGEASNLIDDESIKYYSQMELERKKEEKVDISKFNPSKDSTFWVNRDIKNVDVELTYHGQSPLYENINITFPVKGTFKKVRKTQSKPKIDFYGKVNGEKKVFKLKLGAEVHSEITAGALASTLGFHADISRYVRGFKLILPKDVSIIKFKREWNSYFSSYDVDKYILEEGKTKKGKTFLIFKEALIETKPEGITRVGPWAWGSLGHKSLRETRGLVLFNMWISNNDQKEDGNNKLALREDHNGNKDFYHYQHDLGFSFGRFFKEKPQEFKWNIIKSVSDKQVDISYQNFQENSGFEHVTYSDAKWMVRLIAQLTRDQISQSVKLGGWPTEIGMLLTEKLISRRNHMVKAFDLSEEFSEIPFDRYIETKNGILNNGNLTYSEFPGSSQSFKGELYEILEPIYDGLEDLAIKAALLATSSFDTYVVSGEKFGYESDLIAEVEVGVDRKIIENPDQKGRDDNFLVQDTVEVSFSLGLGLVTRGKVNYVKSFKIVYPVKSKDEGKYKNGFIFNALLPYHIRKAKLPKDYILILEDSLEGEGELLLGMDNFPISVGISKIYGSLTRTVISKKTNSFEVFRDVSPYKASLARLYAELLIFKVPVFESPSIEGLLDRSKYKVSLDKNGEKGEEALEKLITRGDMSGVIELGSKKDISTNFVMNRVDKNILGLYISKDLRRTDDIDETVYGKENQIKNKQMYQVEIDRKSEWNFLGDGETKRNSLRLLGKVEKDNRIENPYLDVKFKINDKGTTNEELKNGYLNIIDKLALSDQFINFNPDIHTKNHLWGNINVSIRLGYNEEALETILNTSNEDYYKMMESISGRGYSFWKRHLAPSRSSINRKSKVRVSNETRKYKERFQRFISEMNMARSESSQKLKYMHLIDGLDHMITRKEDSFDIKFLSAINKLVGKDKYYMKAMVTVPEEKEMILPAKTPWFNNMNENLKRKTKLYQFDFEDPEEIWKVFY